jgi:hypothetical protein
VRHQHKILGGDDMANEGGNSALQRTAEVASEVLIPGGANLIKGDLVNGGAHLVLGLVAKAMFGLPGILLVHANSLVKARTGQHLHGLLGSIQFGPPSTTKTAK